MFLTPNQAEIKTHPALTGPGYQRWHLVLRPLMLPWFHAVLARKENEFETQEVVLIDNVQGLESVLAMSADGARIKALQLMSPGWLNGSQEWRMEDLTEVAISKDKLGQRYTLKNGRCYYWPESSPHEMPSDYELIFQIEPVTA